MSPLERELGSRFGARLRRNEPLAGFTSFRIGGPADLMLVLESEEELAFALAAAHRHGVPAFCLGGGTNLLVSDKGVCGLVTRLGPGFARLTIEGPRASARAAVSFCALVEAVVERGLEGLEFGEGIPGTVGGAMVMNAGAFGSEMARVVDVVQGIDAAGRPRALSREELNFAYRRCDLPVGFVITRVDFELKPGDRSALVARVAELRARRAARQPNGVPNAGSIFKNPPGSFAGRLLEAAGLKGYRLGAAGFSERHANFIVNLGGAQAADVRALIELAQKRVSEDSGVTLEPEVKLIGEW